MLGFKPKSDEVLNHWIAFVEGFQVQPQEFYKSVEEALAARKIPGLEISHVEYGEGGLLSHRRIYLRMLRERLAFDTCASPFGTGFFFSCRTVYSPVIVRLWHILAILAFLCLVYAPLVRLLGFTFANIAIVALVIAVAQVFQNAVASQLGDLDAALLKIPILGPVYERWFRKDTYYRQDTRLVYLEAVPKLVRELAEHVVGTKGVKLLRQYEQSPILGELYKPASSQHKTPPPSDCNEVL